MSGFLGSAVFLLSCFTIICDSYKLEDLLIKCHLTDDACQKRMYETVVVAVSDGVLDLGIAPIDPHPMDPMSVSVLDIVDFKLEKGTTTGYKNCHHVALTTHIERQLAILHVKCNIKTDGIFSVSSSSPVVQKLFGGPINGTGEGTLTLNELDVMFKFHYNARKGDDGEHYLKCRYKETEHSYVYTGETIFEADNLIPDNQDANDFVLNFLEENSSFIKASIGSVYAGKMIKYYNDFCDKFFDVVPAKKYVLDDLSPFINKNKN